MERDWSKPRKATKNQPKKEATENGLGMWL